MSLDRELNMKFEVLLKQALDQWPEEIDVSALTYTNKEKILYSVDGLHEIYEDISSRYTNKAIDFIIVNLHWSILRVVHKAALFVNRVNTRALRVEAIKEQFDSLLNKIRLGGPPEFEDDVVALSKRYFSGN